MRNEPKLPTEYALVKAGSRRATKVGRRPPFLSTEIAPFLADLQGGQAR